MNNGNYQIRGIRGWKPDPFLGFNPIRWPNFLVETGWVWPSDPSKGLIWVELVFTDYRVELSFIKCNPNNLKKFFPSFFLFQIMHYHTKITLPDFTFINLIFNTNFQDTFSLEENTLLTSLKEYLLLLNFMIKQIKEILDLKWVESEPTRKPVFWVWSGWIPGYQILGWVEFGISSFLNFELSWVWARLSPTPRGE